jgi:hypothetical protein
LISSEASRNNYFYWTKLLIHDYDSNIIDGLQRGRGRSFNLQIDHGIPDPDGAIPQKDTFDHGHCSAPASCDYAFEAYTRYNALFFYLPTRYCPLPLPHLE